MLACLLLTAPGSAHPFKTPGPSSRHPTGRRPSALALALPHSPGAQPPIGAAGLAWCNRSTPSHGTAVLRGDLLARLRRTRQEQGGIFQPHRDGTRPVLSRARCCPAWNRSGCHARPPHGRRGRGPLPPLFAVPTLCGSLALAFRFGASIPPFEGCYIPATSSRFGTAQPGGCRLQCFWTAPRDVARQGPPRGSLEPGTACHCSGLNRFSRFLPSPLPARRVSGATFSRPSVRLSVMSEVCKTPIPKRLLTAGQRCPCYASPVCPPVGVRRVVGLALPGPRFPTTPALAGPLYVSGVGQQDARMAHQCVNYSPGAIARRWQRTAVFARAPRSAAVQRTRPGPS